MTLHLVLDHSALVPCGDKPAEEKEAIRVLGGALPRVEAVWYASAEYSKTLAAVCTREWEHHHPLPRLQAALKRTARLLQALAKSRSVVCRERVVGEVPLKLHVVARTALKRLSARQRELVEELSRTHRLTEEDAELLAVSLLAHSYASSRGSELYLVTADSELEQAATRLAESLAPSLAVLRPSQLLPALL